MKNTDERFKRLVTHAESMLCLLMEEIRVKYADYPICIMKYIEKEINEDSIEVRFDNEEATILYLPDADSKNISVHLFLDSLENEDKFIDYLIEMADYSFRQLYIIIEKGSNFYMKSIPLRKDFKGTKNA